jgi:hypothetical protein
MALSGARYAEKQGAGHPGGGEAPRLHVDYAHRRWVSREALLALQSCTRACCLPRS